MFVVLTTSTILQKQNGFRYTLPSTSTQTLVFDSRSPNGAFYDLKITGRINIGRDSDYNPAYAWLQHVKLYLNYFPNSEDELINLATMDTGNISIVHLLLTTLVLKRYTSPRSFRFGVQREQ